MKPAGKGPDFLEPLVMGRDSTVKDVAEKVLKNHGENLKHARIWGQSAKFGGQKVGGSHVLLDKDIVELHA